MQKKLKYIRKIIIIIIDFLYKFVPFKKLLPYEIFTYGFLGGFNMLFDTFLYFVFYNYIFQKQNVDLIFYVIKAHNAAVIAVFPITFTTGFLLAKYITFSGSYLKGKVQLFRYLLSVAGSIVLTLVLVDVFVDVFCWWATISKIISTIIVTVYSFLIQRHYTFKK